MKRVLITREAENCRKVGNIIISRGARAFCLPMIDTKPLTYSFKKKYYDICILTSPAAVRYFAEYDIGVGVYYVVGSSTMKAVEKLLKVDQDCIIKPKTSYYAENMIFNTDMSGKTVVYPGPAKRISRFEYLDNIETADIYETVPVFYEDLCVKSFISNNRITDILFFSPSAVHSFMLNKGLFLNSINIYAVGKTTQKTLKSYGISAKISEKQTAESLIDKVLEG